MEDPTPQDEMHNTPQDARIDIEYDDIPATIESDEDQQEVEDLVNRATTLGTHAPSQIALGYVSNALNATSTSDRFTFWAPAEREEVGLGSLVRHHATGPDGSSRDTYGIITGSQAQTLGLEDFAVHAYEHDGAPPLSGIQPSRSRRRPVVNYEARVLSANPNLQRPVLSGPVEPVTAADLGPVHGQSADPWPPANMTILGFYRDPSGNYGALAEERARVLGPKQGHLLASGQPGAGKTSKYLTFLISEVARLRPTLKAGGPRVASVVFNVKGADLLFLDHPDLSNLDADDRAMWKAAGVDVNNRPFQRVRYFVPLAEDGLNLRSLRNNPAADQAGYSTTMPFALGIQELWPYLHLLFSTDNTPTANLLAELADELEKRYRNEGGYSYAQVMDLLDEINCPKEERAQRWKDYALSTIRAVRQRLSTLPATLGGLIDLTGRGSGLNTLTALSHGDLVVIDLERIMTDSREPGAAEASIKIITALILARLTETMTRRGAQVDVDHVVVFADELNRLAPRRGDKGIGDYLAQLARTTRDRGVILFGAGQFRSGINEDILKAAAIHYTTQTPEFELDDRMYSSLSREIKARLTRLLPGEVMVQYPSVRTGVFARFPRPFVMAGGTEWQVRFPTLPPRPAEDCLHAWLMRLDPNHPPTLDSVTTFLQSLPNWPGDTPEGPLGSAVATLRQLEIARSQSANHTETPWEAFQRIMNERHAARNASPTEPIDTPDSFF